MPILEFALDATSQYRVQVHLNTHQGPVSVMLNHRVLGSLVTIEEQMAGKNFRLPDSSLLRVSISNGHVQVWCNGQPLLQTSLSHVSQVLEPQERHMSRSVITWLALNMLIFGALVIWFSLNAGVATPASNLFAPLLSLGLLNVCGLVGLFALLIWKKWGLYVVAGSALANLAVAIIFSLMDVRAFLPLIGLILLSLVLRSSGLWRMMN